MKSESFEGAPGMKPNNLSQQTYPWAQQWTHNPTQAKEMQQNLGSFWEQSGAVFSLPTNIM